MHGWVWGGAAAKFVKSDFFRGSRRKDVEERSAHSTKTVRAAMLPTIRRHALRAAAAAALAYAVYAWLTYDDDDELEEELIQRNDHSEATRQLRGRCPSFNVTDEQGNLQGAVLDERTMGALTRMNLFVTLSTHLDVRVRVCILVCAFRLGLACG